MNLFGSLSVSSPMKLHSLFVLCAVKIPSGEKRWQGGNCVEIRQKSEPKDTTDMKLLSCLTVDCLTAARCRAAACRWAEVLFFFFKRTATQLRTELGVEPSPAAHCGIPYPANDLHMVFPYCGTIDSGYYCYGQCQAGYESSSSIYASCTRGILTYYGQCTSGASVFLMCSVELIHPLGFVSAYFLEATPSRGIQRGFVWSPTPCQAQVIPQQQGAQTG